MKIPDYLVFFLYIIVTLAVGAAFSRRQKDRDDFFLAGRSMKWLPIGLSVMVTAFSAINYTAFSGEVFSHGLYVALSIPVFALVAFPVIRIIMPFYYRMNLTSAYEYLEKRFDVRVRALASGLFIIWQIFWMATVLYVPCKVLSVITGLPVADFILLAGIVATLYTAAGGIKAVMWTDVLQFFVLFGGILAGVFIATTHTPGGFSGMLKLAAGGGLLKPFFPYDPKMFSFNPTIRITLWSSLIGTFTAFLARYGADQTVVQRYFTARSLKDARRGFHLNYISAMVSLGALTFLGFAIYAFSFSSGILDTKGAQPIFHFGAFVRAMPAGITGLIVAGLFAATMSSIDSGINSCSAALVTDFLDRFARRARLLRMARLRILSAVFGAAATVLALNVGELGSIFEIANKIINGIGSPLLAIFLLGMFSRRANSTGMLAGGILGAVWSAWVSFGVTSLALHYYAVVNLIGTLVLCYLLSLLTAPFLPLQTEEKLQWLWRRQSAE